MESLMSLNYVKHRSAPSVELQTKRDNADVSSFDDADRRFRFRNDSSKFEKIPRRKIPKQNIVCRLRDHEQGTSRSRKFRPGTSFNRVHALYTCVFPNVTISDASKPSVYLRKFSPDGRFLLAFSHDFAAVHVYEFRGPATANAMLAERNGGCESLSEFSECNIFNEVVNDVEIRGAAFDTFFLLKHVVDIPPLFNGHYFRECSLFTSDGEHVILGSVCAPSDPAPFSNSYRNHESLRPNPRLILEHYALWILHIPTGVFTDQKLFTYDKIHFTSGNQGMSLVDDVLAVLSVQKQTVYIFRITAGGALETLTYLGEYCHLDDRQCFERIFPEYRESFVSQQTNQVLYSLKQRLLSHMFRQAWPDIKSVRYYYRIFDQLVALKMWKLQLLDDRTILIKYSTEDAILQRVSEIGTQPALFMVYDFVSTEVYSVYEHDSEDLLVLLESFCDHFRVPPSRFTSSISSSASSRQLHELLKSTIEHARFGGSSEAVKRLLLQLPTPAQGFSPSPYLDMELFSYDEKIISMSERPKTCSEGAVRFYGRECGILKFRLHTGFANSHSPANRNLPHNARVAFYPHPFAPFFVSVQRSPLDYYVLNFHFRYQNISR